MSNLPVGKNTPYPGASESLYGHWSGSALIVPATISKNIFPHHHHLLLLVFILFFYKKFVFHASVFNSYLYRWICAWSHRIRRAHPDDDQIVNQSGAEELPLGVQRHLARLGHLL